MVKKLKKRSLPKKSKNSLLKKGKRFKGVIDAGTVYGVLLLAIVLGGAYMMLGNISPNIASPDQGQPVIPKNPNDNSVHSNLQLKDFAAITLTPTPTDTPTPTPTPTPQPPAPAGGGGGGGGGGGSTCFVKGTKILMANKTEKNIEDVKPGDKVLGYDFKTNKIAVETVEQMDRPIRNDYYDVKLADGTVVGVTDEHPLYTTEGWKSIDPKHTFQENPNIPIAGVLKVGDKVFKDSSKYVAITAIIHKNGPVHAYNLKQVEGYNDFFANDILAHNKGGGSGGGGGGGGGAPDAM
jgi:Hint module